MVSAERLRDLGICVEDAVDLRYCHPLVRVVADQFLLSRGPAADQEPASAPSDRIQSRLELRRRYHRRVSFVPLEKICITADDEVDVVGRARWIT